jgi:hypothetical protein
MPSTLCLCLQARAWTTATAGERNTLARVGGVVVTHPHDHLTHYPTMISALLQTYAQHVLGATSQSTQGHSVCLVSYQGKIETKSKQMLIDASLGARNKGCGCPHLPSPLPCPPAPLLSMPSPHHPTAIPLPHLSHSPYQTCAPQTPAAQPGLSPMAAGSPAKARTMCAPATWATPARTAPPVATAFGQLQMGRAVRNSMRGRPVIGGDGF